MESDSDVVEELGKKQATRLVTNHVVPYTVIEAVAETPKLDTLQSLRDRPTSLAPSSSLLTPERDKPAPSRTLLDLRNHLPS